VIPGEWLLCDEPIEINTGRRGLRLSVRNTGDRPIQVGSHFHFFEVNRALDFDRPAALGMRLDVPSGQSIRFEAGDERDVELVELVGSGRVIGFNNLLDGATSAPSTARRALMRAASRGFAGMQDWLETEAKARDEHAWSRS
jgi:urease subunit beta/urease subunit gamma/beta